MSDDPVCPCEGVDHPREVDNPPGRTAITYRVGDYGSFREALLQSRAGERDLAGYRPTAEGDYALQALEWWAYLADVLTFYNERIANASYLGTALFDDEIARLVLPLGYRRRAGVGAKAWLGALVSASASMTLPAGLAIQSKPGPGEDPQVFELDADTVVLPGGAIKVDPVLPTAIAGRTSLRLRGSITSVKEGDRLLLVKKSSTQLALHASTKVTSKASPISSSPLVKATLPLGIFAGFETAPIVVEVASVSAEKDLRGRARTRVTFDAALDDDLSGNVGDYQLLRSDTTTGLFAYPNDGTLTATTIHLASPVRSIAAGDPVLVEWSGGPAPVLVASYAEHVFSVTLDVAGNTMPVPHGVLTLYASTPLSDPLPDPSVVRVRYGFHQVAALVDEDPAPPLEAATLTLDPVSPATFASTVGDSVLVEDTTKAGALATVTSASSSQIVVAPSDGVPFSLTPPLRVLTNLIEVSRGATVSSEILGSGNNATAGQSFVLAKSPLTYFQGSGTDLESTLQIWVNDVEWTEVDTFYGQDPKAHVFVTSEDDEQKTNVLFGDGVNGARLPSGTDNVVASYRYGSGALAPAAGAIATLLKSYPGLQSVRSPVPAGGGADPVPGSEIRRYAPASALTLDRAVSADDYAALAAQAPGVTRVRAELAWDTQQQRALVTIWVSGDSAVQSSVETAIAGAADPNRAFRVIVATPIRIVLALTVRIASSYLVDPVEDDVRSALQDATTGLFGATRAGIGAAIYRSQIYEACLSVEGVVAVEALSLTEPDDHPHQSPSRPRYAPGAGRFFDLADADLTVTVLGGSA